MNTKYTVRSLVHALMLSGTKLAHLTLVAMAAMLYADWLRAEKLFPALRLLFLVRMYLIGRMYQIAADVGEFVTSVRRVQVPASAHS